MAIRSKGEIGNIGETRPSSDSEAATMYKLKGRSSNMRTGQSFENKELVRLAGLILLIGQANWLIKVD